MPCLPENVFNLAQHKNTLQRFDIDIFIVLDSYETLVTVSDDKQWAAYLRWRVPKHGVNQSIGKHNITLAHSLTTHFLFNSDDLRKVNVCAQYFPVY